MKEPIVDVPPTTKVVEERSNRFSSTSTDHRKGQNLTLKERRQLREEKRIRDKEIERNEDNRLII